ncbi:uncharacterized protein LOC143385717 [Callospermophilus lateralis]|uniref:uncharacterized protein LOC143385717 n=1 Tax=Callospermophilus lateralis TaxID=76772 RepID=UPI004038D590
MGEPIARELGFQQMTSLVDEYLLSMTMGYGQETAVCFVRFPNPVAACRPLDQTRRPAAPCSRGGGGGTARSPATRGRWRCAFVGCTPAAGSTKRGAPRAPAASRGARRGPCARGCSACRAGREAGGVSPGGGIPRRLGRLPRTSPLATPPSAPSSLAFLPNPARSYPGPQEPDLAQPRAAAVAPVAASPPVSGLCPGSPEEPVRAAGWEGGAAQPIRLLFLLLPLLLSPRVPGPCAPQHPRRPGLGTQFQTLG